MGYTPCSQTDSADMTDAGRDATARCGAVAVLMSLFTCNSSVIRYGPPCPDQDSARTGVLFAMRRLGAFSTRIHVSGSSVDCCRSQT